MRSFRPRMRSSSRACIVCRALDRDISAVMSPGRVERVDEARPARRGEDRAALGRRRAHGADQTACFVELDELRERRAHRGIQIAGVDAAEAVGRGDREPRARATRDERCPLSSVSLRRTLVRTARPPRPKPRQPSGPLVASERNDVGVKKRKPSLATRSGRRATRPRSHLRSRRWSLGSMRGWIHRPWLCCDERVRPSSRTSRQSVSMVPPTRDGARARRSSLRVARASPSRRYTRGESAIPPPRTATRFNAAPRRRGRPASR